MATHDCPGHNPVNRDALAAGAWAEHKDGSIIYVEGTEAGDVIYSMFDLSKDPIIEYRDAMPEANFKKTFSWKPGEPSGNGVNEKWKWHDKTPMPWKDRIIKAGVTDGQRLASANDIMTAAQRVAESLKIKGARISKDMSYKANDTRQRVGGIMQKISRAIAELRK